MKCGYAIVLSLLISSLGCKEPVVESQEVVRPVKILQVTTDGRSGKAGYPGRVAASKEAELSFGVDGKLVALPVKDGDVVKKGRVLARINAENYSARLELTLAKERAARADYERHKQLIAASATTKQQLDFAKRNYEIATAQTRLTRKNMTDTVLRAPFSGVIARTNVENFQSVRAKQPIMLLQDVNKNGFEVKVDIPERDVAGAEKGLTLAQRTEQMTPKVLLSSSSNLEIPAYIKKVTTVADPKTRTFEVTLGFAPPEDVTVAPGMTARVIVVWPPVKGKEQKIIIPARAIVQGPDKDRAKVWVIDPESMIATGMPIKVGQLTGDEIEVLEGLESGVSIAVSGVQQLRDGMTVSRYQMKNY